VEITVDHVVPRIHARDHAAGFAPAAPERADGLLESLTHLVGSAEPAVVFGSLARLCVVNFCASVVIDICEGESARYRISYPRDRIRVMEPDADSDGNVHGVSFNCAEDSPAPYAGAAWFTWHDHRPTQAEEILAALLIDRGVAIVAQHRLEDDLEAVRRLAEELRLSLVSDRRVGIAIGILMRTHAITEDVAFHRLCVASQNNRQQLRDITDEVVRVGYLDRCLVPTRRLWPRDHT
jgi:hypothetical protein